MDNSKNIFLSVILSYLIGIIILLVVPYFQIFSISTTIEIYADYIILRTNLVFGFLLAGFLMFLMKKFDSVFEIAAISLWSAFFLSFLTTFDSILSNPEVFQFLNLLALALPLALIKAAAIFFNMALVVLGTYYLYYLRTHHQPFA